MRAVFWAVLLAEPEGPPALSAAGGVLGVADGAAARRPLRRRQRPYPPAAAPDNSWERGGAAAADLAARDAAAAAGVPRAKAGAAGSTAGKESAGDAAAPGTVAAAGAAVLPPPPEAGQGSDNLMRQLHKGVGITPKKMLCDAWKWLGVLGDFHPFSVGDASSFEPFTASLKISCLQRIFQRLQDRLANLTAQSC